MLVYVKEAFVSLIRNKEVVFLLTLTALIAAFNKASLQGYLRVIINFLQALLIVITYSYLIKSETSKDSPSLLRSTKGAWKLLPRFIGLFVYFILGIVVILASQPFLLGKLYGDSAKTIMLSDPFVYANVMLITVILCPIYLYSPLFVVLRNCFVYEGLREGYKFVASRLWARIAPCFLVLFAGVILDGINVSSYILSVGKHLVFYLALFCAVSISLRIFKESNIAYVSAKTVIEEKVSQSPGKKKFIQIVKLR